jgi:hypothetical protein
MIESGSFFADLFVFTLANWVVNERKTQHWQARSDLIGIFA